MGSHSLRELSHTVSGARGCHRGSEPVPGAPPRDTGASPQPGRGRPSCPSSPSPAGGMSSHGCLCCVPPGHLYSRPLFKNVSALFQAGCSLCHHHPCSHSDTNCGVTAACSPASCSGRSPSRVPGEMLPGEMLRQDHTRPPAGLGPVFKPCFHPSVYFSPKQLLPQLLGQVCRRPTGNWARGGWFSPSSPRAQGGTALATLLSSSPFSRAQNGPGFPNPSPGLPPFGVPQALEASTLGTGRGLADGNLGPAPGNAAPAAPPTVPAAFRGTPSRPGSPSQPSRSSARSGR